MAISFFALTFRGEVARSAGEGTCFDNYVLPLFYRLFAEFSAFLSPSTASGPPSPFGDGRVLLPLPTARGRQFLSFPMIQWVGGGFVTVDGGTKTA